MKKVLVETILLEYYFLFSHDVIKKLHIITETNPQLAKLVAEQVT